MGLPVLFSLDYFFRVLTRVSKSRTFLKLFLLTLFVTIPTSYQIINLVRPYADNFADKLTTIVDTMYPEELVVTIKDGVASTNVTEPYYVTFSDEDMAAIIPDYEESGGQAAYRLLAIDTKGRAEDFERYQSLALLTDSSIVYYSDDAIQISPLREVGDMEISKVVIDNLIEEIEVEKIQEYLTIGSMVFPVAIFFFVLIILSYWMFFLTFLAYIMTRINQVKVTFRVLYRYMVAIAFVPLIVQGLTTYIPGYSDWLTSIHASVFTIIILTLAYVGIKRYALEKSNSKQSSSDSALVPDAPPPPKHGAVVHMDIAGDMAKMEESLKK